MTAPLTCEYCDQPATHVTNDSVEPLCGACLVDQYADPRDAATRLTPTSARQLSEYICGVGDGSPMINDGWYC